MLAGLDARRLLADPRDERDANRACGAGKGMALVIPNRPNRTGPFPLEEEYDRDRRKIERFFGRLKP